MLLLFLAVIAFTFACRTAFFWHHGRLLAGTHADEPFHYAAELLRIAPDHYPDDPAVQDTRDALEPYASFFRFMAWLVAKSGLGLREASIAVCWTANAIYLAGVMLLLRWLGVSPWYCALGTILVSQRFAFIGGQSLVTHGLAIPREVWQSLLPWFLLWFLAGRRDAWRLVVFYGALGGVFAATYPPWAVNLGLAFGLVDLWRIVRQRNWRDLFWLTAAAAICAGIVGGLNLGKATDLGSESGALLDRLNPSKPIYLAKSFRQFVFFSLLGLWAFWELGWTRVKEQEPLRRLWHLWIVTVVACWIYQPVERLFPPLAMLLTGRLSLIGALVSMVVLVFCLHQCFSGFARWKRIVIVGGVIALCFFPARKAYRGRLDPELMEFCVSLKGRTPVEALFFLPPVEDGQYFRVYAERGMWISPYDKTTLVHTKKDYALMKDRVATLKGFYEPEATPAEREVVLKRLRSDGVDYVVTRAGDSWAASLSWPVVFQQGPWQLRAPPSIP